MPEDIRILDGNARGRRILPDEEMTFRLLRLFPGDIGYRENLRLFRENYTQIGRRIQPRAAAAFGELSTGKKVLCLVMTLGGLISDYIESRCRSHAYDEALLFGAMADSCLFAFEEQLLPQIRSIVNEKGYGICARLETPADISAGEVRRALEITGAEKILGVRATREGMLHPVKSMCMVYVLTEEVHAFLAGHDCTSCTAGTCTMRKSRSRQTTGRMTIPAGVRVLDYMRTQGVQLAAPCGGRGVCGKCGVQVVRGKLEIGTADAICCPPSKTAEGWRLACQAETTEEIEILFPSGKEAFAVQAECTDGASEHAASESRRPGGKRGIAIDLGTTTLAASLTDCADGRVLRTVTGLNRQRTYGADVLSRIRAAERGSGEELKRLIRRDLAELILRLTKGGKVASPEDGFSHPDGGTGAQTEGDRSEGKAPAAGSVIDKIVIAGNTTMEHLLLGYPAEGLGKWPFRPVSLGGETLRAEELFGEVLRDGQERAAFAAAGEAEVLILPGCSTYIGADIAAGMMCAGMENESTDRKLLFVDLGTNGEMAVTDGRRILAASTACGPALEGGKLSCGTGSIPGAVCHVRRDPAQQPFALLTETIGGGVPVGLCGTGAIEVLDVLSKEGIMDAYGTLAEPWFSEGVFLADGADGEKIVLTQADIREIQMAKGAIRAGIEILLSRAGIRAEELDEVILAGGFGCSLDPEAAESCGLLPPGCAEKTRAAGNTSLAGAGKVLSQPDALEHIRAIIEKTEEVTLGNEEGFSECYIRFMNFEGEGQDDEGRI